MRIGIISDTHNYFDPNIPRLFKGVEHILHGGDVGMSRIIQELNGIAPVTAVLGNTDDPGTRLRQTEVVELAGRKVLLHHIVNPHALTDSLQARIARERPDVVVFGHTHKPFCEKIDGVLYVNPGYAGKTRFGLPRSVAILECDDSGLRHEYMPL